MQQKNPEIAPNILQFLVEKSDLEEALRVIREKAQGKCFINTEEKGRQVLIDVVLYSDAAEGEVKELIQEIQEAKVEIRSYREGSADTQVDF